MIEKIEQTLDGETITVLVPENKEDEKKLEQMLKKKEADDLESMQKDSDSDVTKTLGY